MIVIGITGTLGAGKGAVVDYLVKEKGFVHFWAREFIVEEIKRRGLPVNRDTMTSTSNDLRAKFSPGYIAEELYQKAEVLGKNCVIESLRAEGEINSLRANKNFHLFAVDAEPRRRYERVWQRQSETDKISYEKFLADEEREFESDDPTKQNLSRCIRLADFVFNNDGTLEQLHNQVDEALAEIIKRENN